MSSESLPRGGLAEPDAPTRRTPDLVGRRARRRLRRGERAGRLGRRVERRYRTGVRRCHTGNRRCHGWNVERRRGGHHHGVHRRPVDRMHGSRGMLQQSGLRERRHSRRRSAARGTMRFGYRSPAHRRGSRRSYARSSRRPIAPSFRRTATTTTCSSSPRPGARPAHSSHAPGGTTPPVRRRATYRPT